VALKECFYECAASTATATAVSAKHSPTISTAGRFMARMIVKASHIENAKHRQRHSQLLSRMARSRHDLVEVQRRPRGEDKAVRRAVDQPDADKPRDRVQRVLAGSTGVGAITDKLIDRPRPLVVRVKEPVHHSPVVHVVRLDSGIR
jgi:hypothetical protein